MDQNVSMLSVSRGDAPADVLLANGRIVNVFSGEIEAADVAIFAGKIAGIGRDYRAKQIVDLKGAYVAPGLIDAHVHIESSLCLPAEFARAVVPRGVTTVVADPHEIANVCGEAGVRFMADASRGLPLRVVMMAPSCVPATDMATAGASLKSEDLARLLNDGIVHGLAEVMNFPGVINGDANVAVKLETFARRAIDGHAPGILGKPLNAYIAAGVGSDHECVSVEEAKEKLARGLYILIREATNARNLDALLPLVTQANSRRICFCTDDRTPGDLLGEGSVDHMIRRAIQFGIDPITALRMATLNTSEWFGLHDRGAIAPGRVADLMVFDDLNCPTAREVYSAGTKVAENGVASFKPKSSLEIPRDIVETVQLSQEKAWSIAVPSRGRQIRVIGLRPNQLVTDSLTFEPLVRDGNVQADVQRDILKMVVIERHRRSGRVGVGFVHGFGLKRGAIIGTVAHDHHNIVAIGCDDESILRGVQNLAVTGGGMQVVDGDKVLAKLSLPIAGLMSDRPITEVRDGYEKLLSAARDLGSPLHDPFMAMSFMALEVIPSLKLTDLGLVDVEQFKIVDLFT